VRVSSIPRMHYGARTLKSRLCLDSASVPSRLVTAVVVMGLIVMGQRCVAPSRWGPERNNPSAAKAGFIAKQFTYGLMLAAAR
jgi:hypothetical protein